MTEGDKAFYKRRIREELKKANAVENRQLRQLHLRWALMYQERIDGIPNNVTRELEARLLDGGYVIEEMAASSEHAMRESVAHNEAPFRRAVGGWPADGKVPSHLSLDLG